MKALLMFLLRFFHPGPSAHEVACLHQDVRDKVHANRNIAMMAVGSSRRSTKVSNSALETAEAAIRLLEEARRGEDRDAVH